MRPGIYRHYKGALYRVLFTALMSDNDKKREAYVVYFSMEKGEMNVRRLEEFQEYITTTDGQRITRFTHLHD